MTSQSLTRTLNLSPMNSRPHLLITGKPGVGKTTLIKLLLSETENINYSGFYTQEIRYKGKRIGFQLIWVPQKTAETLASVNIDTPFKLGKYRINKELMDKVALRIKGLQNIDVLIIDEIGPMELFSYEFKRVIIDALRSNNPPILGTIQLKLIGRLREWGIANRVVVKELTKNNFNLIHRYCKDWITSLLPG